MKCNTCGFTCEQNFSYCPNCGAGPFPAFVSENQAAATVLAALKDNLFLILCVLVSAGCIFSITADNRPLLQILTADLLWLTYAKASKGIADPEQLRCVSGTVYAQYVISYVVAGLLLGLGVLLGLLFNTLALLPGITDSIPEDIAPFVDLLTSAPGTLLFIIFGVAAVCITLLNIFSMRYIHRFAKSVYQSIQKGVLDLKYPNAARIWLFIFAGMNGLSALGSLSGNFTAALSNGANCAACIIAGILIGKYLMPQE